MPKVAPPPEYRTQRVQHPDGTIEELQVKIVARATQRKRARKLAPAPGGGERSAESGEPDKAPTPRKK